MSSCCCKPDPAPEAPSCCAPKRRIDWLFWSCLVIVAAAYVAHFFFHDSLVDSRLGAFTHGAYELMNKMWWGILLGIVAIGVIGTVPREFVTAVLGPGGRFSGILRACGAGLLLDLCNHGILMIAMKLYERGASLGQVFAFLIASPWNSLSTTLILIALIGIKWTLIIIALSAMIGILIVVVLLLVFVSANLVNLIRVREGKEAFTFKGTLAYTKELALNPYIATFGNFVAFIIGLIIIVPIARGVGLSQGYQPDQPIWFSHKIHAGTYEIDCQYCHTGASKGKNAWIPSTNVCMNCHKAIKVGSISGEAEISKIYNHYENDIPIEWVRIHNLPDLAYFNHQQHVVAGEVECQTCHGPIEEMDVVYQYAPLSMGWCINCHRETEVQSDLYEALGRDDVHTVEDIGGLDCARCHY